MNGETTTQNQASFFRRNAFNIVASAAVTVIVSSGAAYLAMRAGLPDLIQNEISATKKWISAPSRETSAREALEKHALPEMDATIILDAVTREVPACRRVEREDLEKICYQVLTEVNPGL
ncbi:MAG: hypothetical protein ACT4OY_06985 [Alphaproteobacteria bacterium]